MIDEDKAFFESEDVSRVFETISAQNFLSVSIETRPLDSSCQQILTETDYIKRSFCEEDDFR